MKSQVLQTYSAMVDEPPCVVLFQKGNDIEISLPTWHL